MTTFPVPFIAVSGTATTLQVPTKLVSEFLASVLNTNHWKWNPELIHERALRFRKAMVEQGKVDVDSPPPDVVIQTDGEMKAHKSKAAAA